jgi:lysophospholipase L1-like esterase
MLAMLSVALTLATAEALLAWHERSNAVPAAMSAEGDSPQGRAEGPPRDDSRLRNLVAAAAIPVSADVVDQAGRRQSMMTMPREWERRPAAVEGAARAALWHGVLHVYDANGMRRTSEFGAKQAGSFRIAIVGDSLTYGDGVEARHTYSALLQRLLERDYAVEVLNLGSDGLQSEDVRNRVLEFVPRLRPDLVIYGVCHNDFLPAGVGQYAVNDAWALPLPDSFKQELASRSRLIRLTSDGYNAALMRLGYRADFFDDILKDFRNYQGRFAADAAAMNTYVLSQGLPPVVAMVLDQFPLQNSRGHAITLAAERHLAAAGMTVLDTEPYYRRYDGQNLAVSRWEGHPNEIAHGIWARMLEAHLRGRADLQRFSLRNG